MNETGADARVGRLGRLRAALRTQFSLAADRADDADIEARIRAEVPVRGTNLWVLVLAIFVASIGLNVNSTAVIIGAMLISPLMGPIMGVGFGVGIRDLPLIREAAKHLAIATLIALITSTVYFMVSPLRAVNSELLARTTPTIWDVLIATFGGLAGIVAATRRSKSNVIPGVAIATALMPPLCTAGYGLAIGSWRYFLGAFYLYTINSVFIAAASAVVTGAFHVRSKQFVDPRTEGRVRFYLGVVVTATMLPSLYLAYELVGQEVFRNRAMQFVQTQFESPHTHVADVDIDPTRKTIDVSLIGKYVDQTLIAAAETRLQGAGLGGAQLRVFQSGDQRIDLTTLRSSVLRDLYTQSRAELDRKDAALAKLQIDVDALKTHPDPLRNIPAELQALYPQLLDVLVSEGANRDGDGGASEVNTVILNVRVAHRMPDGERRRIEDWLRTRTGAPKVRLIVEVR
jgi:uncharacterized hydrophobic protein (TIGR00271 family)